MTSFTIFLVDDEESIRLSVGFALKRKYQIHQFPSAEEALQALKTERADLILLDVGLPGMSGIDALRVIKAEFPDIIVIMITAYEDINTVITAMKQGAYDYVVKPIHLDDLKMSIANALQTIRMRKEIQQLQEQFLRENIPCFVGESNVVQDMMHLVERVAKSPDAPVLVLGESGTGKELIASTIHYKSPNFKGPFVTLNCASIPGELIESELFGYEKGAFSGASASGKKGLVEQAAGGTLFLDEVGDLSTEAQAKLLRFLESGEYFRLGGTRKLYVKTRIVSATNRKLDALIQQSSFREDLFYRLSVIRIEVPSLNLRREDIVPIAEYFLVGFNRKYGKHFLSISAEAQRLLSQHHWKGNVRELRNVIERSVLMEDGTEITAPGLLSQGIGAAPHPQTAEPNEPGKFPTLPDEGIDLEALENHYLEEALHKTGGNDRKAAKLVGMSYYAFRYRKKRLNTSTNNPPETR